MEVNKQREFVREFSSNGITAESTERLEVYSWIQPCFYLYSELDAWEVPLSVDGLRTVLAGEI